MDSFFGTIPFAAGNGLYKYLQRFRNDRQRLDRVISHILHTIENHPQLRTLRDDPHRLVDMIEGQMDLWIMKNGTEGEDGITMEEGRSLKRKLSGLVWRGDFGQLRHGDGRPPKRSRLDGRPVRAAARASGYAGLDPVPRHSVPRHRAPQRDLSSVPWVQVLPSTPSDAENEALYVEMRDSVDGQEDESGGDHGHGEDDSGDDDSVGDVDEEHGEEDKDEDEDKDDDDIEAFYVEMRDGVNGQEDGSGEESYHDGNDGGDDGSLEDVGEEHSAENKDEDEDNDDDDDDSNDDDNHSKSNSSLASHISGRNPVPQRSRTSTPSPLQEFNTDHPAPRTRSSSICVSVDDQDEEYYLPLVSVTLTGQVRNVTPRPRKRVLEPGLDIDAGHTTLRPQVPLDHQYINIQDHDDDDEEEEYEPFFTMQYRSDGTVIPRQPYRTNSPTDTRPNSSTPQAPPGSNSFNDNTNEENSRHLTVDYLEDSLNGEHEDNRRVKPHDEANQVSDDDNWDLHAGPGDVYPFLSGGASTNATHNTQNVNAQGSGPRNSIERKSTTPKSSPSKKTKSPKQLPNRLSPGSSSGRTVRSPSPSPSSEGYCASSTGYGFEYPSSPEESFAAPGDVVKPWDQKADSAEISRAIAWAVDQKLPRSDPNVTRSGKRREPPPTTGRRLSTIWSGGTPESSAPASSQTSRRESRSLQKPNSHNSSAVNLNKETHDQVLQDNIFYINQRRNLLPLGPRRPPSSAEELFINNAPPGSDSENRLDKAVLQVAVEDIAARSDAELTAWMEAEQKRADAAMQRLMDEYGDRQILPPSVTTSGNMESKKPAGYVFPTVEDDDE
jgi:hypothetical protein